METAIDKAVDTYGVEAWGNGFFAVNGRGHLVVRLGPDRAGEADLFDVVSELDRQGYRVPLLIRFPQLIATQVERLHEAFEAAIHEFDYQARNLAVYPLKVNPQRVVIESYLAAGWPYDYGLEAGSKGELCAAMALEQPPESLLVLNGFKDAEFVELAFRAAAAGKRVAIVIEKLNELDYVLERLERPGPLPIVGARVKLYSRGAGRWERSSGEASKFGLTSTELLEVIRRLRAAGHIDRLQLLHFHIGSQVTEIKRVKNAIKEAARVYAKLRHMGVPVQFFDVGGGVAVDYDGSRSSFASSANYSMQEYANDVVYQTKLITSEERVPDPVIVTESGRVLTAYHAVLVVNVQGEIETEVEEVTPLTPRDDDPQVLQELDDLKRTINAKNFHEFYHDALELREELFTHFDLGLIDLEQRARGEVLFWDIVEQAERYARLAGPRYAGEEFDHVRKLLSATYLTNFSVFAAVPDHWAVDQLFPILPIHHLDSPASEYATLCDITCDSDGVIDKFIDYRDIKEALELHRLRSGEPYYLAICLVGAYQEMLGNWHNMFGTPHEAHVRIDEGGWRIEQVVPGSKLCDTLRRAGYDCGELGRSFRQMVERRVREGRLSGEAAEELAQYYLQALAAYPYLDPACCNGSR